MEVVCDQFGFWEAKLLVRPYNPAGMADPHSHLDLGNPRIRAQHTTDTYIYTYYTYTHANDFISHSSMNIWGKVGKQDTTFIPKKNQNKNKTHHIWCRLSRMAKKDDIFYLHLFKDEKIWLYNFANVPFVMFNKFIIYNNFELNNRFKPITYKLKSGIKTAIYSNHI